MEDIDTQIAELQKKKKQIEEENISIDGLLNNFCHSISQIPLIDIQNSLEQKIKNNIYIKSLENQYGFWEKMNKIEYCGEKTSGIKTLLDNNLPEKIPYKLLDKSIIDKFEKDYEIKLFVKHYKHKFVNTNNFNFIVNEGRIEEYLLLFKKKITDKFNRYLYATYKYIFPKNYYNEQPHGSFIKNQKEIIELQNNPLKLIINQVDMTDPLFICYNLVRKIEDKFSE